MSIFKKTADAQPLGRNSFDLSQKRLFTASAGELLPCYCVEAVPGDKFDINVSDFLRTQTCNTAAFSRIKQYVHFFFVPYRLLSTQLSQYLMRSPRMDSTVFKPFAGDAMSPSFSQFRRNLTFPYYRILKHLVSRMNKIPYKNDKPLITESTTIDWILSYQEASDTLQAANTLKLLDLLEYGCGSINYHHIMAHDSATYSFGLQDIYKVTDYTQQPTVEFIQDNSTAQTRVNLLRLLAYNRIYQDFYRDPRLETFNSVYSNIDDRSLYIASNTDVSRDSLEKYDTNILTHFLAGDFTIRYRNYPKDYFTSADVNPFKQDSLLNRLPFSEYGYGQTALGNLGKDAGTEVRPQSVQNGVVGSSSPALLVNSLPLNNVTSLRSMYALERWASRQAHSSSQSYGDLVKAHFGISVPDSDDCARFLGGDSAPVVINENISTASTESASLGSLSGVGKSSFDKRHISFEAKEHGVIIGIFSVMPEPDYNAYGPDRHNLHQLPEDFFTPEFDGLGYQAVNTMEFSNIGVSTLIPNLANQPVASLNEVFGFMPIYSEYRTKVDKVFDEFRSSLPLSYWVNPRRIADYNQPISTAVCKCFPSDLDSIFQIDWLQKVKVPSFKATKNGKGSSEVTVPEHIGLVTNDQFFVNLEVDCKAIRHMSSDGVIF